jgi:membrane-associated phospholipid phosphatase
MTILVFCFLCSYLGYLLFPTLPPYRFLDHGGELQGLWLAGTLHGWIDAAEANRWDCFPSGHTMLSVVSLILVWRWARRAVLPIALLVALLIFSTMALRYHWSWDVLAGALLAWPAVRCCDWLLARDGAAAA